MLQKNIHRLGDAGEDRHIVLVQGLVLPDVVFKETNE